ncbi:MAG TPA: NUDIX domain-containing protein [Candidatus Binatia bacterium]|nr:NUDIX domain-containing protein [Candidatus Binatia bacterium]
MAIPERYNKGYNIGVGGAVVREHRLLLVRRASRHGHGNWQLPGGFIEPDETMEQAVVREVAEETGVVSEVEAVLGLRSRYDPESGNGMYVILLLTPIRGEPIADGREVDHAAYFSLDEIRQLSPLPPVNWEIAQRVLSPDRRLLSPKPLINLNGAKFTLFVG